MVNLTYRASATPFIPATTTVNSGPLTNLQVDANFKAIADALENATPLNSPNFTGNVTIEGTVTASNFNGSVSGTNTGDQILPTSLPASDVYAWAKSVNKPTYTAAEIGLATWATAADKPTYTAAEVSALPLAGGTLTGKLNVTSGTAALPAIAFSANLDTGLYRIGGGIIGFSSNGVYAGKIDPGGHLTMVGSVTAYSDLRLKKDLQVIPNAVDKVSQLTGYTYTRTDSGERQTGLIAQELQKVLPEAVNDSGEYLSVAYGNIVGLLVEAIKELKAEINELKGDR